MLYKVSPFGYFSRVTKVSRGPWFEENNVEDDGLEYFYLFGNGGEKVHLLSNNIPFEDRVKLDRLYHGMVRNYHLSWFAGLWLGTETVLRVQCFKKMALGWRLLSLVGTAFVYKSAFQFYNGMTYGPVVSAFLRKNIEDAHADRFAIKDRKREYFEIDTSQYMNYDFKDLGHDYHAHHGPQPDGETLDSTWLIELDKFLRGEDNKLKEHKNFVNYKFEYMDKSFPTTEKAHDLFYSPLKQAKH